MRKLNRVGEHPTVRKYKFEGWVPAALTKDEGCEKLYELYWNGPKSEVADEDVFLACPHLAGNRRLMFKSEHPGTMRLVNIYEGVGQGHWDHWVTLPDAVAEWDIAYKMAQLADSCQSIEDAQKSGAEMLHVTEWEYSSMSKYYPLPTTEEIRGNGMYTLEEDYILFLTRKACAYHDERVMCYYGRQGETMYVRTTVPPIIQGVF